MIRRIKIFYARLSWAQRFLLAGLLILSSGMLGIGWWVGQQIETGVVHQTAANTALYVSSVVEPNLQGLTSGGPAAPASAAMVTQLLQDNSLGQHITAIKVWDTTGKIVYATEPRDIGLTFPIDSDLTHALHGWVAADIRLLDKPENLYDKDQGKRRLVTYTPVRRTGTNEVIAAVEFCQTVDSLDRDIAVAKRNSWLVLGAATAIMYLLLAGFVRFASDTIRRQQNELGSQVRQLRALHERVRGAAQRTTALNERSLRRISAELHDGPAQDLGFALLRLEHLIPKVERVAPVHVQELPGQTDVSLVRNSLRHAMKEIRAISAGMGLPELENLTLAETAARAVETHEHRTGSAVTLQIGQVAEEAPLPVKIAVYRIIQEALHNAYCHANGIDQQVMLSQSERCLYLTISDGGPGFDETRVAAWDEHLGLVGMRERVESLGGSFKIVSELGHGTRIEAQIPLDGNEI